MKPETKNIDLAKIKMHEKAQPRCEIDFTLVDEYADAIENCATMPAIIVFFDGCHYWLADGYHRVHAELKIGSKHIKATIHQGGPREAILYAVGANADHGKRRSNADKRKAVLTLLEDDEWKGWSDREIARWCCVHWDTVGNIRSSLSETDSIPEPTDTPDPEPQKRRFVHPKTGKETVMKTANIGKSKSEMEQISDKEYDAMTRKREREIKRLHELLDEAENIVKTYCVKKTVHVAMRKLVAAVKKFMAA